MKQWKWYWYRCFRYLGDAGLHGEFYFVGIEARGADEATDRFFAHGYSSYEGPIPDFRIDVVSPRETILVEADPLEKLCAVDI